LLPGLYADATIQLEHKQDALAVPLQAVDRTANGARVAVVDSSNKVEIRSVVLGIQTATDAEVISGLNEGDMVVVSDRSSLKGGQMVQSKSVDLIQYRSPEQQR
jgi:multidrug efflux pump subunit AcrA (membrane-fusion protein)